MLKVQDRLLLLEILKIFLISECLKFHWRAFFSPFFRCLIYFAIQDFNMNRLNPGIKDEHNFLRAIFIFQKLELSEWIMLILGISNFRSNSLGIRFSFGPCKKFVGGCPPTLTPTEFKNRFSMFSSQDIGSSLKSELLRFKFYSLSSKIFKIPWFNLNMNDSL